MRTLKGQLNVFGFTRHEGPSEGSAKRRAVKPGSEEWLLMDRPNALVKVLGFISPSKGRLKPPSGSTLILV